MIAIPERQKASNEISRSKDVAIMTHSFENDVIAPGGKTAKDLVKEGSAQTLDASRWV